MTDFPSWPVLEVCKAARRKAADEAAKRESWGDDLRTVAAHRDRSGSPVGWLWTRPTVRPLKPAIWLLPFFGSIAVGAGASKAGKVALTSVKEILEAKKGGTMSNLEGDAFVSRAEAITSKEDFAVFAKLLLQNYREHRHEWDNATLERYLEALAAFVEKIDGYYANIGTTVDLDRPSWRVFADILLAGRVYE